MKIKLIFSIETKDECAHMPEIKIIKPYNVCYTYIDEYDENTKFGTIIEQLVEKLAITDDRRYILTNLHEVLWAEYFENDLYNIDFSYDDILNLEISKLEKQFKISRMPIELCINPFGIGGEAGRCNGIKFFFHTNEKDIHNKPHIHCCYSGEEFRVDLENLKVLDKPFKNNKKTDLAIKCISRNQKGLIDYWNKVVIKGEYLKFKMMI